MSPSSWQVNSAKRVVVQGMVQQVLQQSSAFGRERGEEAADLCLFLPHVSCCAHVCCCSEGSVMTSDGNWAMFHGLTSSINFIA